MKTPPFKLFPVLDLALTAFAGVALFFLLTNGVPLIESGLIPPLKSKMRYLLFNRIMIPVFTLAMLSLYLRSKEIFRRLSLVKFFDSLSGKHLGACAIVLMFLYAALASYAGFSRHAALETRAFDLGIFAQAVWNTLQGNFLFSSIKEDICLLGDHMSPLLTVLTPFYALWQDPRVLILVQALSMASCLVMITKIAEARTGDRFIALCFLIAYFFLTSPRGTLREDFHPEVLAEPLLMMAFFALEKGKNVLWIAMCVLAALAKENIFGIIFMMAIYAMVFKKRYGLGIALALVSIAAFFFTVKTAIPAISGKPYLYKGFYLHLIKNPAAIVGIICGPETWEYVLKIFAPFLFFSFLSPGTLILTFPVLAQNILSNNPVFRSLTYHYTTGLIPFVAISAIYGLENLSRKYGWQVTHKRLAAVLMLATGLVLSGHSDYYFAWKSRGNITPHKIMMAEKLSLIPASDRVLTHNSLVPQLINRKFIYQFEHNTSPTKKESAIARNADVVVIDENFMEPNTMPLPEVLAELSAAGYATEFEKDGFYILRKK